MKETYLRYVAQRTSKPLTPQGISGFDILKVFFRKSLCSLFQKVRTFSAHNEEISDLNKPAAKFRKNVDFV